MAFGLDGEPPPAASVSAARLAAEAAFAAPTFQPTAHTPALVTVRRARLGMVARQADGDDARPTSGTPPSSHPASDDRSFADVMGKAPRVFRLETARSASTAPAAVATLPVVAKRQRRTAPDKRPGQVLHVVHMQPQPPQPPMATTAAARPLTLLAALARVAPVLDAIQHAQSFSLLDERFEQAWQRLLKQADQLLAQLRSQ